MKTVLITGASAGIGLELVKIYAKENYHCILVSRSEKQLLAIAKEFKTENNKFTVFPKDLTKPNAPEEIIKKIPEVDILINNAGFGHLEEFISHDPKNQKDMVELNITSLTLLTHYYLKKMAEKGEGKILNVASIASYYPGPLMAVYYATKAYVRSFTEAIRYEMKDTNITISCLCPGPVITKFQEAANINRSHSMLKGALPADRVAMDAYMGLENNKQNIIPGFNTKMIAFLSRFLPQTMKAKIIYDIQKKS